MNNYCSPIPPDPEKQCKDCEHLGRLTSGERENYCTLLEIWIEFQGTCKHWEKKEE